MTSLTRVGKVHTPPAAMPRHMPVVLASVCTKRAPSQVQASCVQQSPTPRPLKRPEMTPSDASLAASVTRRG